MRLRALVLLPLLLVACTPSRQVGLAGRDYGGRVDLTPNIGRGDPVSPGVTDLATNPVLDRDIDKPAGGDW